MHLPNDDSKMHTASKNRTFLATFDIQRNYAYPLSSAEGSWFLVP